MGNAIFPSLPGLDWNVVRTPQWRTRIQGTQSGKETRLAYMNAPLWKYTLTHNVLRQDSIYSELQQLQGFFNARQGSFDPFLFNDPTDNAVANHGFGVGDGSTTQFQLQRTIAGPRASYGSGPIPHPVSTVPRKNLVLQSDITTGATGWSLSGTVSATAEFSYAGRPFTKIFTATGGDVNRSATFTGNGTKAFSFLVRQWGGNIGLGHLLVFDGTAGQYRARIEINVAADGTITATALNGVVLGVESWGDGVYRVLAQAPGVVAANDNGVYASDTGATTLPAFLVSGIQVEDVDTPTSLMPNAGSALTVVPSYYPSPADGFEPIYDPNGSLSIFVNGVLKTPGTDYTVNAAGLLTFTSVPASGAVLTWTGSYYKRVRFDQDAAEFNNFLYQLYEQKSLSFVSVL